MKNSVKSLAKSLVFSLALLLTGNLTASVSNSIKIEVDGNQKSVLLSFNDVNNGEVIILLKDDNDAILHKEVVAIQTNFAKKFNLKNLPAGLYFLEISDELTEVIQPLKVSKSTIDLDPSARTKFYKPVYRFENNKLNINFLAINSDKINVYVFDAQNQQIFSEKFETNGKPFGQRFDLSTLEKGEYNIKIKAGNQFFYKTVTIK